MAIGTTEMAILIGFAVLLFGSKKIPELARSLGLAKGEYEMAVSEVRSPSEAERDMDRGGMTDDAADESE
jgi:TatA/E family protein of Tat protein translocase